MVWGAISGEGRTHIYRLSNSILTAIPYQDEIFGPIVISYACAVSPGFPWCTIMSHVVEVYEQLLEDEGTDTTDFPMLT